MAEHPSFFTGIADAAKFHAAIARIDELNSQDPNTDAVDGRAIPRELLYSQRLCEWVLRLCPQASEELRLAARAQHICRWQKPRGSYPMTRPGYHQWKTDLKRYHAATAADIVRAVGYTDSTVQRVSELILKKNFPADAETRVLEDSLCMMFLQYQLSDLAAKLDDEKTVNALRKSWEKMTDTARQEALALKYSEREMKLIQQALQPR